MNNNNVFAIAYKYHTLGYSIIPSGGAETHKKALVTWKPFQTRKATEEEIGQWQETLNPTIWAVVTGEISKLFIIDIDKPPAIAMMEAARIKPHIKTSRGFHYYCRWPGWNVITKAGILPGCDIRGMGGYANFCGQNETASYTVLQIPTEDTLIPFDKLPHELQQVLRPPKTTRPKAEPVTDRIPEGKRNDVLTSLAGTMRRRGMTESAIEAALLEVNATQCERPLPEREVREIAKSVARYEPKSDTTHFNLTDLGNAERLVKQYGDTLRYCYERKSWLVWQSTHWQWDHGDKIMTYAQKTVRSIYEEAAREDDQDERKKTADWAKASESNMRLKAMIQQAENMRPVYLKELDVNPWLFNVNNGTIDLKTGELLPRRREDLITKLVSIDYIPGVPCTLWQQTLERIFKGKPQLIRYVKCIAGYCMTGVTLTQAFFLNHGKGANGKSTFMNTLAKALGPYAHQGRPSLLCVNKYEGKTGHQEDEANLYGKRCLMVTEIPRGKRLDVDKVKAWTGGEPITCSHKHEKEFSFVPTHKTWLSANHEPSVADSTISTWRRFKKIPFDVTIPKSEQVEDWPQKLEAELPGILAWMVEGCLEWQTLGLEEPSEVTEATEDYRLKEDSLGSFIEDRCFVDDKTVEGKSELRTAYENWCTAMDIEALRARDYRDRMIEKEFKDAVGHGNKKMWRGLRLLNDQELAQWEQVMAKAKELETKGQTVTLVTVVTEFPINSLCEGTLAKVYRKYGNPSNQSNQELLPPPYPIGSCRNCGCADYWLRENEWVCKVCHPEPGGNDNAE